VHRKQSEVFSLNEKKKNSLSNKNPFILLERFRFCRARQPQEIATIDRIIVRKKIPKIIGIKIVDGSS
jgi:hypothetical protein